MRVLDLGTGLGHVARIVGELVGSTGSVVGIDQSATAIAAARQRSHDAGAANVTFVEGDVTTWRASEPFDAIVGRLVLFHVADPAAVVRHHLGNLRPGGTFAAIDFDIGAVRSEPAIPIVTEASAWVMQAFRAVGAWPRIGPRLRPILGQAGLTNVTTIGMQVYMSPQDSGAAQLAGIVRSLAPAIVRHGIATEEQLDIATLERRITEAVAQANAVILLPTVVGAWGISESAHG